MGLLCSSNKHLKYFSVLISKTVNIDKDNLHKEKLFGQAIIFMSVKVSWDQKDWEL